MVLAKIIFHLLQDGSMWRAVYGGVNKDRPNFSSGVHPCTTLALEAIPSATKTIFFVGCILLLYRAIYEEPTQIMVMVVNGRECW